MKRRSCQRFSQRSRLFQGALALFIALTLITISHRGNAAAATFNGSGFTIADNGTVGHQRSVCQAYRAVSRVCQSH